MDYAIAFEKLFMMGFKGFPGPDTTVPIGPAGAFFARSFMWYELHKDLGMCVVDLLEPSKGYEYSETDLEASRRWNRLQVEHACKAVSDRDGFQAVIDVCS